MARSPGKKKAAPVDGHGRFNRSAAPAYAKRLVEEAYKAVQPDLSSMDGWDRMGETAEKAWAKSQPQRKTSAPNPAWDLSWDDREKFVSAVKYSSTVKTAEDVAEKQKVLATFGKPALTPEEFTIANMGVDMFESVGQFMEATGNTSPQLNFARDPLEDTGRYVRLKGGTGEDGKPLKDSQLFMELPPSGDTHRFLDLECEEGKAQVILLPRGSYEIAGEYEKNGLIQFGIDAAKKARDEGALSVQSEVDIPNYGPASPSCYDTFEAGRDSTPDVYRETADFFGIPSGGRVTLYPDRFSEEMDITGGRTEEPFGRIARPGSAYAQLMSAKAEADRKAQELGSDGAERDATD